MLLDQFRGDGGFGHGLNHLTFPRQFRGT
jgi:hypothetical protein